jgi:hypothetical protein
MPTILLKKSDTASAVPSTANLTNLAGGAEVAVNTADKRMFTMNSSSAVVELGTNPSSLTCADASFTVARVGSLTISSLSLTNATFASATITNLTSTSATISSALTLSGGTANGVLYLNGSKVATSGTALVFDGTNLGIGTSSPNCKFEVKGGSAITTLANSYTNAGLLHQYSSSILLAIGSDGTNPVLQGVNATNNTAKDLTLQPLGGNLGIGTSSPAQRLDVVSTGTTPLKLTGATACQINLNDGSQSANWGLGVGGVGITGIASPSTYPLVMYTNGVERLRLDSSGNLGLGVTPSAWAAAWKVLQVERSAFASVSSAGTYVGYNWRNDSGDKYIATAAATLYEQATGAHRWYNAPSGTAGNAISFTQAMTLDASGNLLVGTTTANWSTAGRGLVEINGSSSFLFGGKVGGTQTAYFAGSSGGAEINVTTNNPLIFSTNNTERARITSGGDVGIGTTSPGAKLDVRGVIKGTNPGNTIETVVSYTGDAGVTGTLTNHPYVFYANNAERARITAGGNILIGKTNDDDSGAGIRLVGTGLVQVTRAGADPLSVNRDTDDGVLVSLRQAGTEEGTISVSGNTVSYNAFAGSHWSQLQDGSKPDILRGTVMESINELCVWPNEKNERLPKAKISDTVGSKKVYGVFMAWDNDWTTTNDMYVTAVGAFICRVNGSVTVQEGDLLESNGDGTARVQADDIIRSSTIGKVTSTVRTHQYDDGSYCVPTVLYCG